MCNVCDVCDVCGVCGVCVYVCGEREGEREREIVYKYARNCVCILVRVTECANKCLRA